MKHASDAHLNYCRQVRQQFARKLSVQEPWRGRSAHAHVVDLCSSSEKFLLPDGGKLVEDSNLRALDDTQPLRLPFERIAIEYSVSPLFPRKSSELARCSKRLVLARECEDVIAVRLVFFFDDDHEWKCGPEARLNRINWKRKDPTGGPDLLFTFALDPNFPLVPASDYLDEMRALLGLLNVLQCKNVRVDQSPARKTGRRPSPALPFDSYHILVLDPDRQSGPGRGPIGTHRSPREHVRRGHIRTLPTGDRIWVNATIVKAGQAAGKVMKDYAIKRPGQPSNRCGLSPSWSPSNAT